MRSVSAKAHKTVQLPFTVMILHGLDLIQSLLIRNLHLLKGLS